jgi:hypothetical protein
MGSDDEFHDAPEHLSRLNSARSSASKLSSSSAYFDAPEDMPAPGMHPSCCALRLVSVLQLVSANPSASHP